MDDVLTSSGQVFHPLLVCLLPESPDSWVNDMPSLHNIKYRTYNKQYRKCPLMLIKYILKFDLASLQDLLHANLRLHAWCLCLLHAVPILTHTELTRLVSLPQVMQGDSHRAHLGPKSVTSPCCCPSPFQAAWLLRPQWWRTQSPRAVSTASPAYTFIALMRWGIKMKVAGAIYKPLKASFPFT